MNKIWSSVIAAIGKKPNTINILSSLFAILGGLLFGFILMLIINPNLAFYGLYRITVGPLSSMRDIGWVLRNAAPILLTGLSVAFAFRTGLFNIGATGQLTVGAFFALYVGVNWTWLGPAHLWVALLAAVLGGAIWGAIPGLLKAFRNVHEVVASIMLNYIALYMINLMVRTVLYHPDERAIYPASSARLPSWGLDSVFSFPGMNIGIIIALVVAVIIHIVLNKTVFGYELKSVGLSRPAARYAGINEKSRVIYSMVIAGAIAGLAGGLMFLTSGVPFRLSNTLLMEGFTGIAVALLALSAPLGVIFAALFFSWITRGGNLADRAYDPELIEIIVAVIIYFSALSLFMKRVIADFVKRRTKEDVQLQESQGDIT